MFLIVRPDHLGALFRRADAENQAILKTAFAHVWREIVVEDVKGDATKTTDYRLRKRIAELVHGVSIREV